MKLLYIWIEEFRNILHQGIIVDDEYSISVNDPDNVVSNYYADDGTRIIYTGTSPRFGTKIFDRHITCQKNGAYKRAGASIDSIAAIVGKNAAGKSSILECLSAYEPQKIDRHYFLAFLNKDAHCVEIRSRGIRVTADKCVRANVSTHGSYEKYIIPLDGYSPAQAMASNENTHCFFLGTQKKSGTYHGYPVLGLPTIIGDLSAFNTANSHEGVFDFLCSFPRLGGEDNKLVVYLKEEDDRYEEDYFIDDEYSAEQRKIFFIYKLAKILFSNLRTYLYHQKPEYMMDGSRLRLPNEEQLLEEDKQCTYLTAFVNIKYPQAGSKSFAKFNIDCVPQNEIEKILSFFATSTFSFSGKCKYDRYISAVKELFQYLYDADDKLFTALYKLEIPFEKQYKPIVASLQECIQLDNLDGNWMSGIWVDFEWFSVGEYHLAMLFSAIYQRMSEENHALNKPDVIWFLDEPEMHMHPELNRSFLSDINAAMKEFIDGGYVRSCQLILVTHSPFIVQRLSDYTSSLTLVCKNGHQITTHPFDNLPQLKLSGRSDFSFGLIMFKIFDVPTVELHNELYGVLQEKNGQYNEKDIEQWFARNGLIQNHNWVREHKGVAQTPYPVTLQTYIRNSIHHPENRSNQYKYTESDLRTSIEEMIKLL